MSFNLLLKTRKLLLEAVMTRISDNLSIYLIITGIESETKPTLLKPSNSLQLFILLDISLI
jgi:hypothetical protein